MKKFNLLALFLSASFLVYLTGCQEEGVQPSTEDAVGSGSAVITVGNGNEFFLPGNTTWTFGNTYLLDGLVRVPSGVTLTIEPGVIVKGLSGVAGSIPGTLLVERGGIINADGTAAQPIIFTSAEPVGSRAPGDWGGLVILGNSWVNVAAGVNGAPADHVGAIEGLPAGFTPGLYGSGSSNQFVNQDDNSGTLRWIRIEYAGNVLTEGNETNGLTLGGVGRGTTVEHIWVSYGADDGIEWFGGWVRSKYLICTNNTDDDFDSDQGNNSLVQFGIIQKNPLISVAGSGGARAFESNGDEDDVAPGTANLTSNPTYSNITVIGPAGPFPPYCTGVNPDFDHGVAVRDLSRLDIFNSAIGGFPGDQFFLENPQTWGGRSTAKNNQVVRPFITGSRISSVGAPFVASKWSNVAIAANGCAGSSQDVATFLGLRGAAWRTPELNGQPQPDFVPPASSVLLSGADFSDLLLQPPYFDVVTFRGGINRDAGGPGSAAAWGLSSAWYEYTPQDNPY
ncbi:MAG: hypothetical protein MJA30_27185 [Cytophagales bacterium]|nr:hypothetical protein [Cytophagales bacterium]